MTQNAKHTPGPWFLDDNRRGSHISVHSKAHGSLATVVWQMADDYRAGKPSPQCEANAHLIAAAPELHDALAAARAVLTSIVGTAEESRIIAEQLAQIDAALAKAGAGA